MIQGADCFASKINIEVQWASEQSIAAVEKNGGVITTSYFDIMSVTALTNPEKWFKGRNINLNLIILMRFQCPIKLLYQ